MVFQEREEGNEEKRRTVLLVPHPCVTAINSIFHPRIGKLRTFFIRDGLDTVEGGILFETEVDHDSPDVIIIYRNRMAMVFEGALFDQEGIN